LLNDFVKVIKQRAERLSISNQPDIYFVSQGREVPILSKNRDVPQLLILPLSSAGSAPSLAKRIERSDDIEQELQSLFQEIIDKLSQFLGGKGDAEDDKIWRLKIAQRMNYAISIWGQNGLLNKDSGLFGIASERVTGSGFQDTLYVMDDDEKITIAESKYTRHPAPPITEFTPISDLSRPLLKSIVDYRNAAMHAQPKPVNSIYVHISDSIDQFPHGFIEKIAQRCLDFGRLQNSINAEIVILSTADDVQSLDIELNQLEKIVLQRRVLEQHLYVASDRSEFIEKFTQTEVAKKWQSDFVPTITSIEFSESTQYKNINPAIALYSPLWLFDFSSSREIKQEKININPS
jgi:hypothetical protein